MRFAKAVLMLPLLLLPAKGAAQGTGSISGTITSAETGQALSGVEVVVQGTERRAVSTTNGRYLLLNVPIGARTLRASMLGYADFDAENVMVVAGQTTALNIQLKTQAIALAEVVVVGYGQQRRATITGAVESVTGAKLAETPVVNVQSALAGRIPGVVMNNRTGVPGGEEGYIRVRGAASLGGIVEPLVVIDGVASRSGGYERLNPNDIESMTVLKDASAAIYGAQAGAGVLLITTRQGRGPAQIRYNANFGFSRPTFLPDLVDAGDYAVYINEVRTRLGQARLYTDEEIQKFRDGSDPENYPNTDWIGAITRDGPAPQMDHSLEVSGATEAVRYFLSGRYATQGNILRNGALQYDQYALRSNLSAQLHPNLNVGLRLHGRFEETRGPQASANGVFEQASRNYPVAHAWYPNGYPAIGVEFNNPVTMLDERGGYDQERDWYGQSNVDFRLDLPAITSGLYVSGMAAFDISAGDNKSQSRMFDWYDYERQTGNYISYRDRTGPINLSVSSSNNSRRTLNFRLGWDRAFGAHSFQSFAAYEQAQGYSRSISASRTNMPSDVIEDLFVGSTEGMTNNSSTGQSARAHYFGRLSYSYDDRYMAEFTLRRDGSERFPPQGRWGTFPGVSAGWRISRESFFKLPAVTDLKLKASWGRLGNDGSGNFQHLVLYSTSAQAYAFGTTPASAFGLFPGVSPNPFITWEKVEKQNYGIEASLWDGRVSMDLNYFRDYRSDILTSRESTVPAYTGLSLPNENWGEVSNQGFDGSVTVTGSNLGIQWRVSPNLTWAKSEIVAMNESPNTPEYQKQIGHQVGTSLVYVDCGIFRTQAEIDARPTLAGTQVGDLCYEDVNEDGSITSLDQVRIYDSQYPRMQYGINIGGQARRFTLDMVWQGQGGSKIRVNPMEINATVTPVKWIFEDRWTPENPDGRWPASFDRQNTVTYRASTFWLRDATFLRLKSAALSYDVPTSIANRIALANLRLSLSGFNLLTFSGINDYDPENNRVNTYYYPQQRVISLGVTAGLNRL